MSRGKNMGLVVALAVLWAASGYLGGVVVGLLSGGAALGGIGAASHVLVGLSLFKLITRDPFAERIFFEGPAEGEEHGDFRVGCLWSLPASLLVINPLLWLIIKLVSRWL